MAHDQHDQHGARRGPDRLAALALGRVARTAWLAMTSAADVRPHGDDVPPDTSRAQRPQDHRP